MEKKKLLIVVASIFLVVSSMLTVRAVREHSPSSMLFDANLEAILAPEFLQPGKGNCFDKDQYVFNVNALFLPCDLCVFFFGVPIDPWPDGSCN